MAKQYRVLTGLNIKDERAEVGDVINVPAKSVTWLKAVGAIEPIEDTDIPTLKGA